VIGGSLVGVNPIDSALVDILSTACCLAVLVLLLFLASSREWTMGVQEDRRG
jgi:hypothetical protein